MSHARISSKLTVLLGVIVVTYGATRYVTIRNLILTHESIVDTIHKEYAVDVGREVFSLAEVTEEVALIREKMFNSQGPHQWTQGLILTTAAGLVLILTGLYSSRVPEKVNGAPQPREQPDDRE